MKTYEGMEIYVHIFLTLAIDADERRASLRSHNLSEKRTPVSIR
jgi:hypothetical protein